MLLPDPKEEPTTTDETLHSDPVVKEDTEEIEWWIPDERPSPRRINHESDGA